MLSKILVPFLLLTSLVYQPKSSFLCLVQTKPQCREVIIWNEYLKVILSAAREVSLRVRTPTVRGRLHQGIISHLALLRCADLPFPLSYIPD